MNSKNVLKKHIYFRGLLDSIDVYPRKSRISFLNKNKQISIFVYYRVAGLGRQNATLWFNSTSRVLVPQRTARWRCHNANEHWLDADISLRSHSHRISEPVAERRTGIFSGNQQLLFFSFFITKVTGRKQLGFAY